MDAVADALVQVPQPWPLGSCVVTVGMIVALISDAGTERTRCTGPPLPPMVTVYMPGSHESLGARKVIAVRFQETYTSLHL